MPEVAFMLGPRVIYANEFRQWVGPGDKVAPPKGEVAVPNTDVTNQ